MALSPSSAIPVDLGGRSYEVRIGSGLLGDIADQAEGFVAPYQRLGTVPVIADVNARAHHGESLSASLASAGYDIAWYDVASGEDSKSWSSLERLTNWMLEQGIERRNHVFALGGGVVGDLVGFASAVLKRGCGFVQLPTTLLSQVDSSVGGKTAINTGLGKNMIGAFHQPSLVLIDTDTLGSLPPREMQAGYAEVIKYGLLGDAGFFEWLETNGGAVLARQEDELVHAIATSVQAKARIVAEDERETSGVRALLNLGHTFGHALEAETGFSDRLLHGEGVALGMVLAARYSARRGQISQADADRAASAIAAAGLPSEIAALDMDCDGKRLVDHMMHDKKMSAGTLPFILLNALGQAYVAKDVDLADVGAFLDEQLQG
jgi:3-dehydroquinate synthase